MANSQEKTGGYMRTVLRFVALFSFAGLLAAPAATIYNNLTPNNQIAIATQPESAGLEIETGDDFLLNSQSIINTASFVGLIVPGTAGTPSISDVVVEMYRVFPKDSDAIRTPNVPTRVNSPSDV